MKCQIIALVNVHNWYCRSAISIGETGRAFRHRMYEHRLSVNKPKDNRVTPVSKYFTGTNHSIKDMQFSILDWCTPKYNTPSTAHRRRREQWWMWNIGAVHPIGINQFIWILCILWSFIHTHGDQPPPPPPPPLPLYLRHLNHSLKH